MLSYKIINIVYIIMQTLCNFWILIFWITTLSFLLNTSNFLNLLIYSEFAWIILYCLYILTGILNDNLTLLTTSFLILGFASIEFSLGYLLIILFRNFNKSTSLRDLDQLWFNYIYKSTSNNIIKTKWNFFS